MPVTTINVREHVMDAHRNDKIAARVRQQLEGTRTPAFNLISSPGAGKTRLLEWTLAALNMELDIAVVAGDCETRTDADRLARHTGHLVQAAVTHGGCHLEASHIERALRAVDLDYTDLLLIENVGDLVCPAGWDLGEESKIVLLSVAEGEDKPVKYPNAFIQADYLVVTKLDLLPHVDFDLERAVANAYAVNPLLRVFYTSARSGEGMEEWLAFLREQVDAVCLSMP